eukprot:CAMPEP_0116938530 /NCGR_PEP_ID=MMETSP0467-20121206/32182_1 /TAXON_ID=283647 /ORGANISM="Mesodinium pulex, Strain SPMC105" /LENGTH=71 /DNA_ID=CAMNT_0004620609 /DNA_START=725 /DNA_END=940 /DNA_ORIENTATION=-
MDVFAPIEANCLAIPAEHKTHICRNARKAERLFEQLMDKEEVAFSFTLFGQDLSFLQLSCPEFTVLVDSLD